MKVKSIKPAGIEPVDNMTVDEFHKYVIYGGVILKNCDAMRYFCITRTLSPEMATEADDDFFEDHLVSYDEEMTGGDVDDSYMNY